MAQTGTITIRTESVDWIGQDYPGPFGRGANWINSVIRWTLSDAGVISFVHESQTSNQTSWGICGVNDAYRICVEAQYNTGSGWQRISYNDMGVAICPSLTNTIQVVSGLVNNMPSAALTQNGQLRLLYFANSEPAPTQSLPRAFPSSAYSEVTQIPIEIEVDYRPGAVLDGVWKSHNRSGGSAHIYDGTKWVEMKTSEGGVGMGNPPSIRSNDVWVNQRKLGQE